MAFWDRISSRGNVEDRRGMSGIALGGGGLGIAGIVLILLMNYLGGGDLGDVLGQLEEVQVPQNNQYSAEDFEGQDSYEVFVSTVLGSANDMWANIFAQSNRIYNPPKLVLFRQATQGECGLSTSYVGPHYCPLDETIYLDETFFQEMEARLSAQGGDVAEAYVIAHEVGHHAQNQLGLLESQSNDNEQSIRQELQADCFAGLWAHSIRDLGVFEPGEIQEAMDAAAAVGDDRVQKSAGGTVNQETWTHGSSQQRVEWFTKGYETGSISECETGA